VSGAFYTVRQRVSRVAGGHETVVRRRICALSWVIPARNPGRAAVWPAAAVHVLTASGAVLAFLATLAVFAGDVRAAFLWLFAAVIVDAADGWLARLARVSERLPRVSGARLDDLVDYLTYVFVPMLIVWAARLLPHWKGLPEIQKPPGK